MGQVQSSSPTNMPNVATERSPGEPSTLSKTTTTHPSSNPHLSPGESTHTITPCFQTNGSVRSQTEIEAQPINSLLTSVPNSRPAARMIRAIDSTALSLEQIDSLFQLFVARQTLRNSRLTSPGFLIGFILFFLYYSLPSHRTNTTKVVLFSSGP
jgi:hypothetical protein